MWEQGREGGREDLQNCPETVSFQSIQRLVYTELALKV